MKEASDKNAETFEAGARAMKMALDAKTGDPSVYFADTADPLHAAFRAKAVVHSGPGGMPLMGAAAVSAFDGLLDKPRTGKTLAYIHVPFCETRCLYCMFYQNPYKEDAAHAYAQTLVKELRSQADRAAQKCGPIHAVYFGGGTPTVFSPEDLRFVLRTVRETLPLANDCEITIEGRIHNFDDARVEAALEGGANRFSLGIQTFNTEIRRSMLRVDDRDTMIRRLEAIGRYDEAALVVDLIYGFPGQTMDVWASDLETAASLRLDGVDCYQLNVFEKSPLAKRIALGKLPVAAGTAEKADMFARSVEFFTNENWRRLSNNHWGRTHRERNIYNELGKSSVDCLAFGCGAGGRLAGHSFMIDRDLKSYTARVEAGEKPVQFLMKPGPNWALLRDISAAMDSGAICLGRIGEAYGLELERIAAPVVDQWIEAGLLFRRGRHLIQTVAGQYWHVTLAQLLMKWVESRIQKPAAMPDIDMGAPAAVMHAMRRQMAGAVAASGTRAAEMP